MLAYVCKCLLICFLGGNIMSFYYSDSWFASASDSELNSERERVRSEYANAGLSGLSDNEVDNLYFLLNKFDNEISRRAWAGQDAGYPAHREHGWYLSNDD